MRAAGGQRSLVRTCRAKKRRWIPAASCPIPVAEAARWGAESKDTFLRLTGHAPGIIHQAPHLHDFNPGYAGPPRAGAERSAAILTWKDRSVRSQFLTL